MSQILWSAGEEILSSWLIRGNLASLGQTIWERLPVPLLTGFSGIDF